MFTRFSKEFKITALNIIINNEDFSSNIEMIDKALFEDDEYTLNWFLKIKSFINKYGYINKNIFKQEYGDIVSSLYDGNNVSSSDYVKNNLKKFIFVNSLIGSVQKISDEIISEEFSNIDELKLLGEIDNARNHWIEDKSSGEIDYLSCAKDRLTKLSSITGVPTGITELDELLMGKGLCEGELGAILALTNTGKSGLLINLAYNAMMYGRKVLYVTLEMGNDYVAHRMDMRVNNMNNSEVFNNPEVILNKLNELKDLNNGKFYIKGFQSSKTTVRDIKNYIINKKRKGVEIDFLIVDYADLLTDGNNVSKKEESGYSKNILTYTDLRSLGNELCMPIWTASQSNRLGFQQDIVDMNNFADSFGKAFILDVCICIKPPNDTSRGNKTMTLYLAKNRNGKAGGKIEVFCDWDKMTVDDMNEYRKYHDN